MASCVSIFLGPWWFVSRTRLENVILRMEKNRAGHSPKLLSWLQNGSLGNPPAAPKGLGFPTSFLGLVSFHQLPLGLGKRKGVSTLLAINVTGKIPLVYSHNWKDGNSNAFLTSTVSAIQWNEIISKCLSAMFTIYLIYAILVEFQEYSWPPTKYTHTHIYVYRYTHGYIYICYSPHINECTVIVCLFRIMSTEG